MVRGTWQIGNRRMYCPKCKETFEEGSRRFCPSDGSRLIAETEDPSRNQWEGGIFANLIPKVEPKREMDETLSDVPRFVITEPSAEKLSRSASTPFTGDNPSQARDLGGDFFVLDDIDAEPTAENIFSKSSGKTSSEEKPFVRKINPYEIPAGHVELGGGDRLAVSSAEFQEDNPESFIGRTVKGRYIVTELLGGEDASFAFLADDKIIEDKKVLVRILLEEDDEMLGSIIDEERVSLSHVSHPNIARLIDSGQFTDGTRFLISEYVDALSVSDILSIHGMFPVMRAGRIIRQIASALNEVHQEGILHRDLRPSNVIVEPGDGDSDQATLVNLGASSGDPTEYNLHYKAPEVLDGRVSTIASDIYSLAVVAFEMLTGVLPFKGRTAKDFIRSQYEGLELLPSRRRPELPSAVDSVFQKALAFGVSERYGKARDFGDALFAAIAEAPAAPPFTIVPELDKYASNERLLEIEDSEPKETILKPIETTGAVNQEISPSIPKVDELAWTRRSPEPPETGTSRKKLIAAVGIPLLICLLVFGWYYLVNHPVEPEIPIQLDSNSSLPATAASPVVPDTEMPPMPRAIPQPPNTNYYQNTKQNLKGDLLRNFVGFSMYYPKDWKVNGPQESVVANTRGKFLDISRSSAEGRLKEQMLISYYPSKGTFREDADKFPQMVKEANDTLKKILPGYQMVSEGEIKLNGDWRAYEVKFQGGGTSESGEKLVVWGRRLFIPAARPGVRDGFEITMLATSAADDVRSVDDVGVRGELAAILYSFEPSQNF